MKEAPFDVLADRYASEAMVHLWSPVYKIQLERAVWIAALKAQRKLGMNIPQAAITAYQKMIDVVDLESIRRREEKTRHDIKAKIEEFNALAGHQYVHAGFTSRDLSDNVEQMQILLAMKLVRDRTVAVLTRFRKRAWQYDDLAMCGRSHNVPGQAITLGKRFTNYAQELLIAYEHLDSFITRYPLRGMKGAMGTQQDMLTLLEDEENMDAFEDMMREHLGFHQVLTSVGQVYPRSLDFEAVSVLNQLGSAIGNFAKMVRLSAGQELMHEGFGAEQSGSSAMPHKMNSRTCERVNGLQVVLGGYLTMTQGLLGDQWYEGDVSCSVVRRVALPGAFYALDGMYEAVMTVLDEMEVFKLMVRRELENYLPFISSSRLLMAAVGRGMGREDAHKLIKDAALEALRQMRNGDAPDNPFCELLARTGFPLDRDGIENIVFEPDYGRAVSQVDEIVRKIEEIEKRHPQALDYEPAPLL